MGRKCIDHRAFCEEVARATTFTGAEVEAVMRLAAEIAKKHVENGDIVDFGDIGTLCPSFPDYSAVTLADWSPAASSYLIAVLISFTSFSSKCISKVR